VVSWAATKILSDYSPESETADDVWSGLVQPIHQTPTGQTPFQRMWLAMAAVQSAMDGRSKQHTIQLADAALANGQLLAESLDTSLVGFAFWALVSARELERGFQVGTACHGTNVDDYGNLVGDVRAAVVVEVAGVVTPVPGGAGPLTAALLLAQTSLQLGRSQG
jgi:hypothetical protein